MKTLEEYFTDWESHAFGYGYGTGEEHTLSALKSLMAAVPTEESYDYRKLEAEVGPTVAWLLLNTLHREDVFDYGTSTRFAWLTDRGKVLKKFLDEHTVDELKRLCSRGSTYTGCYPDACNCGPKGYDPDAVCPNPFWGR